MLPIMFFPECAVSHVFPLKCAANYVFPQYVLSIMFLPLNLMPIMFFPKCAANHVFFPRKCRH
jgi:hypothetical protein